MCNYIHMCVVGQVGGLTLSLVESRYFNLSIPVIDWY